MGTHINAPRHQPSELRVDGSRRCIVHHVQDSLPRSVTRTYRQYHTVYWNHQLFHGSTLIHINRINFRLFYLRSVPEFAHVEDEEYPMSNLWSWVYPTI